MNTSVVVQRRFTFMFTEEVLYGPYNCALFGVSLACKRALRLIEDLIS